LKVAEARRKKARKLKQAKDEAVAEIEKFRLDREKMFREYEKLHMGSRDDIASKIELETRAKLDAMNKKVVAAKDRVIDELLKKVLHQVEPKLHRNYKI